MFRQIGNAPSNFYRKINADQIPAHKPDVDDPNAKCTQAASHKTSSTAPAAHNSAAVAPATRSPAATLQVTQKGDAKTGRDDGEETRGEQNEAEETD